MFRRLAIIGIVVVAALIMVLLVTSGREEPAPAPPPPLPELTTGQQEVVKGWEYRHHDPETDKEDMTMSAREAVVDLENETADVLEPVIRIFGDGEQPVTITAPRGQVDPTGKTGVLTATAEGQVTITAEDPDQGLLGKFEKLHFQWGDPQRRVRSEGPVLLQIGEAEISGRNLRSESDMSHFIIPEDVRVTVTGLDIGLARGSKAAADAMQITCSGNLEYDRNTRTVTFYDDVVLTQDRRELHADRLEIMLERNQEGRMHIARALASGREGRGITITEPGPDGEEVGRTLTGTTAEYISATGRLAISGPVEARSGDQRVSGDLMVLETTAKVTTVTGSPARAVAGSELLEAESIVLDESETPALIIARGDPARAHRGSSTLVAPELRLEQASGALDVPGPGELHWESRKAADEAVANGDSSDESEESEPEQTINAVWTGSMHYEGRTATFEGSVHTRRGATELWADRMEVRFDESGGAIEQLSAWGEVRVVDLPQRIKAAELQMDAVANTITAIGTTDAPAETWIDKDMIQAPTIHIDHENGNASTDGPGRLIYHPAAGDRDSPFEVTWQKSMTYDADAGVASFEEHVKSVRGGTAIESDHLNLSILSTGGQAGLGSPVRISGATAWGNVRVTQPLAKGSAIRRGSGDRLLWDADAQTTTLTGDPARLWQGRNVIISSRLTLDEKENVVVGPGAGRLIAYNEDPDTSTASQDTRWQHVAINWQRSVRYDTLAREARFEGDVFVIAGERTLFARDALTAYFDQSEAAGIERVVAEGDAVGDVSVTQGTRSGLGTWLQWDVASEAAELRGEPFALIRLGANEFQLQSFTFERKAGTRPERFRMDGTTFVDFLAR